MIFGLIPTLDGDEALAWTLDPFEESTGTLMLFTNGSVTT